MEINRSRKRCILLAVLQRYTCDARTYECHKKKSLGISFRFLPHKWDRIDIQKCRIIPTILRSVVTKRATTTRRNFLIRVSRIKAPLEADRPANCQYTELAQFDMPRRATRPMQGRREGSGPGGKIKSPPPPQHERACKAKRKETKHRVLK